MIGLLKLFSTPIVFILACLVFGLVLATPVRRKPWMKKLGLCLIAMGILVLYLLSIKPVSNFLAYSLESGYTPPSEETLANLDIIVVLGSGFVPSGGFRKHAEATRGTYSRLFSGVEMFSLSSAKKIILSGRSPWSSRDSDAEVMKDLAIKLGVPSDRIMTETVSRNTMEQAEEISKLFPPNLKMRIGIVTSAMHMLRAESAFVKKYPGDCIIPLPVDYASCRPDYRFDIMDFIPSADYFSLSSFTIHELIGMIWYKLLGAI